MLFLTANAFAASTQPAGKNAYPALTAAAKELRDEAKIGIAVKRSHDTEKEADDRPYTMDEITQLVAENQTAIDQTRKAMQLPYSFPLTGTSIATKNEYPAKFRTIARLFALDAKVKAGSESYAAAMDSALDAIALGELTQSHTTYFGGVMGASSVVIGERAAWEIIPKLSVAESAAAARRLEQIIAKHPPFNETMANERIVARNSIPVFLNAKDPVAMLGDTGYEFVGNESDALKRGIAELRRAGPAAALADVDAAASKTAHLNAGLWKVPSDDAAPVGRYGVTRFLFSLNVPRIRFTIINGEAENRLLLTMLAIHAYEGDHGQLPDNLKQLAPAYIKAVPADVFAAGESLKYGIAGGKAIVYSIGPDGIDDSGDAIDNPGTKTDEARRTPAMDSTGDIVAGVNM